MRVLVADDDVGSRLVAEAAVAALGHECVTAADGNAAWQLVESFRPDVLVSDRAMPGLDGTQLCRAVRAAEHDTYTYVILLTGASDRADVLSGMDSGADDYLIKPLDPFELQTRLLAAERVTTLHAELGRTRALLARQASTDPLTGLRNRLGLQDDLDRLHRVSRRYQRSYCLALCDVDFFKNYNDTYGHQAGDEALRAVARTLSDQLRDADGVYRYGGEEFLCLLPEQDEETAEVAAERVRRAVAALAIPHRNGGATGFLTLSIGLAAHLPGRTVTSHELLAEADRALYAAKAAGRNQVATSGASHVALVAGPRSPLG